MLSNEKSRESDSQISGDQNKITGLLIAGARVHYETKEDGKPGYVFKENQGFHLWVEQYEMEALGVTQEALMDCIAQLEKMGSAQDVKNAIGYRKNQGFQHYGMVIRSEIDPRVKMSVTFHDPNYEKTDFLLGWYVDTDRSDIEMKTDRDQYQPERKVSSDELKSVERAREQAPVPDSISSYTNPEVMLGLKQQECIQPMKEILKSHKENYIHQLVEQKLLETEKKPLKAGGSMEQKKKPVFFEEAVDFWGMPNLEEETSYGEKDAPKPEYSKTVDQYDKEEKGLHDKLQSKEQGMKHVQPGDELAKPESEVGDEYDEKELQSKNIKVGEKPEAGRGDEMEGTGAADKTKDQEDELPKAKIKVGKPGDDHGGTVGESTKRRLGVMERKLSYKQKKALSDRRYKKEDEDMKGKYLKPEQEKEPSDDEIEEAYNGYMSQKKKIKESYATKASAHLKMPRKKMEWARKKSR